MANSICRDCGTEIEWDRLFGKPHCFDAESGISHFDTCPVRIDRGLVRHLSARMRGDVDTFYKKRWRDKFWRSTGDFDRRSLKRAPVAYARAVDLAFVLRFAGGPFSPESWTVPDLAQMVYYGGEDRRERLVALGVDIKVIRRLGDLLMAYTSNYRDTDAFRVGGFYLVKGDATCIMRGDGWGE